MDRITFTSVLNPSYRGELERLLFFNQEQHRLRQTIQSAVQRHGIPRVVVEAGRLRVHLDGGGEAQALFALARGALNSTLAGVAIYLRIEPEVLLLLHLAVQADFSFSGPRADEMLTMRFTAKLREAARRIHGVRVVRVFYGQGACRDLPV